jgi:uncharacterized cupredoxin-like copper-binding protein
MRQRTWMNGLIGAISLVTLAASPAWSHGDDDPTKKRATKPTQLQQVETAFGKTGDPKKISRTIRVGMDDTMRFSPKDITLKQGDTVRFVAKNGGKMMHEMVVGTMAELKEHGQLMKKFPDMEHDEPYMAHVKPGYSEEIVWQFTKRGEFYYACLIPGHFEAGMIGKIVVR